MISYESENVKKYWDRGDGTDSDSNLDPIEECQCQCQQPFYFVPTDRLLSAPDVTLKRSYSTSSTSTTSSAASNGLLTKYLLLLILSISAAISLGIPIALNITVTNDNQLELVHQLLSDDWILIDGHNDFAWNIRKFLRNKLEGMSVDLTEENPWKDSKWSHTDMKRLKEGRVSAQFWAAYVPCSSQHKDSVQLTLEQIDVIQRFTEYFHEYLTFCTSYDDIIAAHKNNKICSLIGVEGGHSLSNSLSVLRTYYSMGVRYLTLTSTCNTPWADSSQVDLPGNHPEHNGLTEFGKQIIYEMNRLGIIIDISHVSIQTMTSAIIASSAPVIFSHSAVYALCNSTRNVPDNVLQLLKKHNGVLMLNFYTKFLTCSEVATIEDVARHLDYLKEIIGEDGIGIGAGYDGINFTPFGLEDVSTYPSLFAHLLTNNWSVEQLRKLAGGNILRVLLQVERRRDEMKRQGVKVGEIEGLKMEGECFTNMV